MKRPDVVADYALVEGNRVVSVKIQSDTYEFNVLLTCEDIDRLDRDDLPISPNEHAITAGTCFNSPAHWSRSDGDILGIVVGHDDVTWDVGIWMPFDTFAAIRHLLLPLRASL